MVDNDQGGVVQFSEFFAFMIMIKRLTPKISELFVKEKSALRIQGVARVFIAVNRLKARIRRKKAIETGEIDDKMDALLDDVE